ncbi:hypothetical protein J1614_010955 [Plenodomus biglobosus]|nr:hypothetical protein J1614_010955 [Plenodomus biglobosus]
MSGLFQHIIKSVMTSLAIGPSAKPAVEESINPFPGRYEHILAPGLRTDFRWAQDVRSSILAYPGHPSVPAQLGQRPHPLVQPRKRHRHLTKERMYHAQEIDPERCSGALCRPFGRDTTHTTMLSTSDVRKNQWKRMIKFPELGESNNVSLQETPVSTRLKVGLGVPSRTSFRWWPVSLRLEYVCYIILTLTSGDVAVMM